MATTWARGVEISAVTRLQAAHNQETGVITVTWGGAARGHSCVTGYTVTVAEGEGAAATVTKDQDTFHHEVQDTEPGATYTIAIAAVSSGFQEDIIGPATEVVVQTL